MMAEEKKILTDEAVEAAEASSTAPVAEEIPEAPAEAAEAAAEAPAEVAAEEVTEKELDISDKLREARSNINRANADARARKSEQEKLQKKSESEAKARLEETERKLQDDERRAQLIAEQKLAALDYAQNYRKKLMKDRQKAMSAAKLREKQEREAEEARVREAKAKEIAELLERERAEAKERGDRATELLNRVTKCAVVDEDGSLRIIDKSEIARNRIEEAKEALKAIKEAQSQAEAMAEETVATEPALTAPAPVAEEPAAAKPEAVAPVVEEPKAEYIPTPVSKKVTEEERREAAAKEVEEFLINEIINTDDGKFVLNIEDDRHIVNLTAEDDDKIAPEGWNPTAERYEQEIAFAKAQHEYVLNALRKSTALAREQLYNLIVEEEDLYNKEIDAIRANRVELANLYASRRTDMLADLDIAPMPVMTPAVASAPVEEPVVAAVEESTVMAAPEEEVFEEPELLEEPAPVEESIEAEEPVEEPVEESTEAEEPAEEPVEENTEAEEPAEEPVEEPAEDEEEAEEKPTDKNAIVYDDPILVEAVKLGENAKTKREFKKHMKKSKKALKYYNKEIARLEELILDGKTGGTIQIPETASRIVMANGKILNIGCTSLSASARLGLTKYTKKLTDSLYSQINRYNDSCAKYASVTGEQLTRVSLFLPEHLANRTGGAVIPAIGYKGRYVEVTGAPKTEAPSTYTFVFPNLAQLIAGAPMQAVPTADTDRQPTMENNISRTTKIESSVKRDEQITSFKVENKKQYKKFTKLIKKNMKAMDKAVKRLEGKGITDSHVSVQVLAIERERVLLASAHLVAAVNVGLEKYISERRRGLINYLIRYNEYADIAARLCDTEITRVSSVTSDRIMESRKLPDMPYMNYVVELFETVGDTTKVIGEHESISAVNNCTFVFGPTPTYTAPVYAAPEQNASYAVSGAAVTGAVAAGAVAGAVIANAAAEPQSTAVESTVAQPAVMAQPAVQEAPAAQPAPVYQSAYAAPAYQPVATAPAYQPVATAPAYQASEPVTGTMNQDAYYASNAEQNAEYVPDSYLTDEEPAYEEPAYEETYEAPSEMGEVIEEYYEEPAQQPAPEEVQTPKLSRKEQKKLAKEAEARKKEAKNYFKEADESYKLLTESLESAEKQKKSVKGNKAGMVVKCLGVEKDIIDLLSDTLATAINLDAPAEANKAKKRLKPAVKHYNELVREYEKYTGQKLTMANTAIVSNIVAGRGYTPLPKLTYVEPVSYGAPVDSAASAPAQNAEQYNASAHRAMRAMDKKELAALIKRNNDTSAGIEKELRRDVTAKNKAEGRDRVVGIVGCIGKQKRVVDLAIDNLVASVEVGSNADIKKEKKALVEKIGAYNELVKEYGVLTGDNLSAIPASMAEDIAAGRPCKGVPTIDVDFGETSYTYEYADPNTYDIQEDNAQRMAKAKSLFEIRKANTKSVEEAALNNRIVAQANKDFAAITALYDYDISMLESERDLNALRFGKPARHAKSRREIAKMIAAFKRDHKKALAYEDSDNKRYYQVIMDDPETVPTKKKKADREKLASLRLQIMSLLNDRDYINGKLISIYTGGMVDINGNSINQQWRRIKSEAAARERKKLRGLEKQIRRLPASPSEKNRLYDFMDRMVDAVSTAELARYRVKYDKEAPSQEKKQLARDAKENYAYADRLYREIKVLIKRYHNRANNAYTGIDAVGAAFGLILLVLIGGIIAVAIMYGPQILEALSGMLGGGN